MDFRSSKAAAAAATLIVLSYILCFTCTSSLNNAAILYSPSPSCYNVTYSPPSSDVTVSPPPSKITKCHTDIILRSGICDTPSPQCCTLLNGMTTQLDAADCLCNALKANVFGLVNVNVDVPIIYLLNGCGLALPPGFRC